MADQPHITRRAALVGALASTAALAVPAVNAATPKPSKLIEAHAAAIVAILREHGCNYAVSIDSKDWGLRPLPGVWYPVTSA